MGAYKKGEIKNVSVAGRYREAEPFGGGVKPLGLRFDELSLLYGEVEPGIPEAYVKVWERMILERIVESHEKDKSQNLDEQLKRLVAEVDELKKENMLLKQKIARFESMGGSGVYGRVSDGNPLDRLSQEEKTLF